MLDMWSDVNDAYHCHNEISNTLFLAHIITGEYVAHYMWLDLRKPALMAQELKSNLWPDINDTLMRYLETSTVWLYIVRSAFIDGFLPTV